MDFVRKIYLEAIFFRQIVFGSHMYLIPMFVEQIGKRPVELCDMALYGCNKQYFFLHFIG